MWLLLSCCCLNERVRFMPLFRTLFYLPSITSGVATVVLWVWILHPTGLLNRMLGGVGIEVKLVWLDDVGVARADLDELLEHRQHDGHLFGGAARRAATAL